MPWPWCARILILTMNPKRLRGQHTTAGRYLDRVTTCLRELNGNQIEIEERAAIWTGNDLSIQCGDRVPVGTREFNLN